MYIIVGLGNPGREYEGTRHNAGFHVIDLLAKEYNINVTEKQLKGLTGKGMIEGQKVILVKPMTYMNLSGECVRPILDYYKVDPESELVVISDDIDLDVGRLRIRKKGSAGGHNGLKSIIQHLGTEGFLRMKVGVGAKRTGQDLANHVLGKFPKAEQEAFEDASVRCASAVAALLKDGPDIAMNKFNS